MSRCPATLPSAPSLQCYLREGHTYAHQAHDAASGYDYHWAADYHEWFR